LRDPSWVQTGMQLLTRREYPQALRPVLYLARSIIHAFQSHHNINFAPPAQHMQRNSRHSRRTGQAAPMTIRNLSLVDPPKPPINVQLKPVGGDSSFRLMLVKPGSTFHEILYSDSPHPIERDRNVPSILC